MTNTEDSTAETRSAARPALSNLRLALILSFVALGFLGFSVSLVPLYNTFCEVTGLNGKTGIAEARTSGIDLTRVVTVEFTSTVMPGLPWQFQPTRRRIEVHPGEPATATYEATNVGEALNDGQAIMSVSPEIAATHFKKIECFCFHKQALKTQETRVLPLVFFVAPDLPRDIRTITVSYAAFPAVKP